MNNNKVPPILVPMRAVRVRTGLVKGNFTKHRSRNVQISSFRGTESGQKLHSLTPLKSVAK